MSTLDKLYNEASTSIFLEVEKLISKLLAHAHNNKDSQSWGKLGDINYISTEIKQLNQFLNDSNKTD